MSRCEICLSTQGVGEYYNRALRKDRAWLCSLCNNGILRFGDDVDALKRAVIYLEKNIKVEVKRCTYPGCDAELFSTGHCPWQCERKVRPDAST